MPTYEFRCPAGHEFEQLFRKISDSPYTLPCPTCGQPAQRKISGGTGLHFKGAGFYITDYGKDGKKDQRDATSSKSPPVKSEPAAPASESSSGEKTGRSSEGAKSESSPAKSSDSTPAPPKGGAKSEPGKGGAKSE